MTRWILNTNRRDPFIARSMIPTRAELFAIGNQRYLGNHWQTTQFVKR